MLLDNHLAPAVYTSVTSLSCLWLTKVLHDVCYLKVLCPTKQLTRFFWISGKSLDLEATLQQGKYSFRAAAQQCLGNKPTI